MKTPGIILGIALGLACGRAEPAPSAFAAQSSPPPALGPSEVDAFHPDRQPGPDGKRAPLPKPAYGGRVIVHVDALPRNGLNGAIENSAVASRIRYEVHETLLLRDWLSTEFQPDLAERWEVAPNGTVITFHLRQEVRWHDGHPFDANDVLFSFRVYANEFVDCGKKRYRFQKIAQAEVLDPLTIRFTWKEPYFDALGTLGDFMCILPAHVYDLSDPDNAEAARRRAADPAWKPTEREQGEFVNQNPHNQQWIGLGPYRIVKWDTQAVEATRFEGYFAPERAGYLDTIRWRYIAPDAAFQALLNGEIDFFGLVSAEDYFGEPTHKPVFTERFYKGTFYTANYWYVGWNLLRPQLSDVGVRTALAMLFDAEEFKRSFYRGLAVQVTGPGSLFAPGYDRELKPLPHDPKAAAALLGEAGWKDTDGDGILDKGGEKLEIELLMLPNNRVGLEFGQLYQESLAQAGVRLRIQQLEWATLNERKDKREFDAIALGWSPPIESDPEQIWHSRTAQEKGSDNYISFSDLQVDALIEKGQRELDPVKRAAVWRELQRLVYDLQPYLFCFNPPRKFAMNRRIRGFQSVVLDPNYVIRRWYYPGGTPGTRPTPTPDPTSPPK